MKWRVFDLSLARGPLVVALALGCCAPGCAARTGAGSASGSSAAHRVELRLDTTVHSDGLQLTWNSVQDSRCPAGVTCIWAGEVTVGIVVGVEGKKTPIVLVLGPRAGKELIQVQQHELHLIEVTPSPRADVEVPRGDYRAVVEIRRAPTP